MALVGFGGRRPIDPRFADAGGGDLGFVVTPPSIAAGDPALLDGLKAAPRDAPGAGLRPEESTESAIRTYWRAEGRRLVLPFGTADEVEGTVRIGLVFGSRCRCRPRRSRCPGSPGRCSRMRPELARDADTFGAADVLTWAVDRPNFVEEHPEVTGPAGTTVF